MNAQMIYDQVLATLQSYPPTGLTFHDVETFFARHRALLISTIQAELDRYSFAQMSASRVTESSWMDDDIDDAMNEHDTDSLDRIELDPVIAEILEHGGLRADLVNDLEPALQPIARSIPRFLRPDGRTWQELAELHYGPEITVVDERPERHWLDDEVMYETIGGYVELVSFALDASFLPSEISDYLEPVDFPVHLVIPRLVGAGGIHRSLLEHLLPVDQARAMRIPGLISPSGLRSLRDAARTIFGDTWQVVEWKETPEERARGIQSVPGFLEILARALDHAASQPEVARLMVQPAFRSSRPA